MNAFPSKDSFFEPFIIMETGEVGFRLAVSKEQVTPKGLPAEGVTYKVAAAKLASTPKIDLYGNHVLTKRANGPDGWIILHFAPPRTQDQRQTPYKEEPGKSRHYQWPTVLHGILFAEDPEFPVEVRVGVNLTVERPRLVARASITRAQFALTRTKLKFYLSDIPFQVPERVQPTTDELEWVVDGQPTRLECLHDTLTLPAAGKQWNVKYSAGQVRGVPSDRRTFNATPMVNWEPFVISQDTQQLGADDGFMYQLVEEWLFPPAVAVPPNF